jgi:lysophospholipase L1-like esterase
MIAQTGWTTTNLQEAVAMESPATDFDLATLLIGVNNQFQNKPFSIYESELVELIDSAIVYAGGDSSKLIVLSIPDYGYSPFGQSRNPSLISTEIDLYNDFARQYCEDNGVSYLYITDITRQGIVNPALVASDQLHPSGLAYEKFVKRLLPIALQKLEPSITH